METSSKKRTIDYDVHPGETLIHMIPNNCNPGLEMYIAEDNNEFKNISILSDSLETMRTLTMELDSHPPSIIDMDKIKEGK